MGDVGGGSVAGFFVGLTGVPIELDGAEVAAESVRSGRFVGFALTINLLCKLILRDCSKVHFGSTCADKEVRAVPFGSEAIAASEGPNPNEKETIVVGAIPLNIVICI